MASFKICIRGMRSDGLFPVYFRVNNGTLAVLMFKEDDELYGCVTVNQNHPFQSDSMAFLDENNLPGIGKWLTKKKLGIYMGVNAGSGFCTYPLYMLLF